MYCDLLNTTLSCAFSFLRLIKLCGKMLKILMPVQNAPFWKHDKLTTGLQRWCSVLVLIICTDEYRYAHWFQNIFLRCPTPRLHCFLSSHWPSFMFLSFVTFFIPSIQIHALINYLNSISRLPYCHCRMQSWNSSMPPKKVLFFPNNKCQTSANCFHLFTISISRKC